jgi:hypothetical protein
MPCTMALRRRATSCGHAMSARVRSWLQARCEAPLCSSDQPAPLSWLPLSPSSPVEALSAAGSRPAEKGVALDGTGLWTQAPKSSSGTPASKALDHATGAPRSRGAGATAATAGTAWRAACCRGLHCPRRARHPRRRPFAALVQLGSSTDSAAAALPRAHRLRASRATGLKRRTLVPSSLPSTQLQRAPHAFRPRRTRAPRLTDVSSGGIAFRTPTPALHISSGPATY